MGQVVRDWNELAGLLEARRAAGERIVTTNGVFDVLHVGHTRYLKAARALGDLLVVGVNSDACTRRLKGPTRPIVPEEERAELLAALKCVDYVTFFDEPIPNALLDVLRPDIHAKGGDYHPEQMPETPIVRRGGGEVVILPFEPGHSTSDIITRILATNKP
ncbi:MAG TPA: D-glycero-beta-D-manno-heptose 1-phosphate adenylyltransferase [Chthonomonadaceae bacterium]|nr:D-glycero-beta-D-manno-heptose 1-phosphate adenylyltransferase [Chthonomonadaceae bacterium]